MICIAGFVMLFITLVLLRTRTEIQMRRASALAFREQFALSAGLETIHAGSRDGVCGDSVLIIGGIAVISVMQAKQAAKIGAAERDEKTP